MSHRSISISTLSPVHIGCDEVYEPSNFVITGGLLHTLDPADLAAELSDTDRKQLVALAEGREPIWPLQRFFRDNAVRFSGLTRHQVAVTDAIVGEYERSAVRPTQRGPAGEATYNLFPIARTAYRPFDNVPYLPGSSLKGSMRTAWLNNLNSGKALTGADRKSASRLQERLLGYEACKFEKDPFRHVLLADAHPEEESTPPPTRVLYAISKKKRPPREGERGSPKLKVFLETLPDALYGAFLGELRLSGKIGWCALCDACNKFYKPQLEAELSHPVLGGVIDADWKTLIRGILSDELSELMTARQGFLLRVGRHSGAESITLDGVRDIKILGPSVDGKQTSTLRSNTTEERFASLTKSGSGNLLPFGWIWIDACDDAHRYLSEALGQKLSIRSAPLREAHRNRLYELEESKVRRAAAALEAEKQKKAAEDAERVEAEAIAARQAALATMSANFRRIEEFKSAFAARAEQLRGGLEKLNAKFHSSARELARDALAGADWTAEEKHAAANAIAEWLPKVVERIDKDQLKKLNLAALRAP